MKKLISAAVSLIMTASLAAPLISSAEGPETLFYFTPKESSDITVENDGTVVITRDSLFKNGGLTISADVFFQDESLSCWNVNARWKSSTPFITLDNVLNPIPTSNDTIMPFAYAQTDEDGNLLTSFKTKYGTMASVSSKNVAIFTCTSQQINGESLTLEPYGDKSDDYPLTSFDMIFDKDIPYGEYEISFVGEANAVDDEQTSIAYFRTDSGSVHNEPNMQNLKIRVTGYNLGDVNNDGTIMPLDASLALAAYARKSTGEEYGLTTEEFSAADIDDDQVIMPSDASNILAYYSYLSTLAPGETTVDIRTYSGI